MASIAPPTFPSPSTRTDPNPHRLNFSNSVFSSSSRLKRASSNFNSHHHSLSRVSRSDSVLCRCNKSGIPDNPSGGDDSLVRGWDSAIQDVFRKTMKRFDDYVNSFWNQDERVGSEVKGGIDYGGVELEDWDWERWRKHFSDVDEQERIVSVLKSQLASAINREDYEDAARLKVAIAAAATSDTIAKAMSHLNRAVQEERYGDAALLRDYAGAGLVGWWAGISEDTHDPYGCIIHISAEHGRYVARSYSPRQLATAKDGAPLFEIFFTMNKKGEYKQQAVYLKRRKAPLDFPIPPFKTSTGTSNFDSLGSTEDRSGLLEENAEDSTDSDERDDDSSLENTLRDLIPGVKVKVLKVTAPGKVDRDLISKVVEQIIEEEDEEQDIELESTDADDEVKDENDDEEDNIVLNADNGIPYGEEQSQIAVKVVVGSLVSKFSPGSQPKDLLRVPARLEKRGRLSFTFTVEEEDDNKRIAGGDGNTSPNKKAKLQGLRSVDHVMLDLAKFIGKGRIPMKVLKDVGELINLTLNQARNHQPLSGSTTFSRIDIPGNQDPLNGLYIGAHGLYTSEVIHLRRKFGQWKEDGRKEEPPNVGFYEYVEAVKLTGDPYVPAGQIAFRAKVGNRYQLPHKGIIPEEFGVVARYRGQGRLAEPGFRNPRWVDGELVILDGKYIKGGPVVGFVYWAPEFHFLVFFNRLRLHR
ncbi:unnamed protein product [Coffea canephora]|uniref:Uncharacterized protein n=1 Tax=Coffea canephora TaxID=49390 RepID=A0A068TM24_COFCA|nr:unnamed protein product [Coffea canephora]